MTEEPGWATRPGRRFSASTLRLAATALLTMLTSVAGVVWIVMAFSDYRRPSGTALAILGAGCALWLVAGLVALVPAVERAIVRRWARLREPTAAEGGRLATAFSRVCARAREDPRQFTLLVEPSDALNASAVGHSLVAVTEPALRALCDERLEAVLAHELGHQDASHAAAMFEIYWWSRPWALAVGLTRGALGCSLWLGCVVLLILLPFLAVGLLPVVIQAAASRYAEREADRFAVELGYGPALAAAITQLQAAAGDRAGRAGGGVLASHPPVPERLAAIHAHAARS